MKLQERGEVKTEKFKYVGVLRKKHGREGSEEQGGLRECQEKRDEGMCRRERCRSVELGRKRGETSSAYPLASQMSVSETPCSSHTPFLIFA